MLAALAARQSSLRACRARARCHPVRFLVSRFRRERRPSVSPPELAPETPVIFVSGTLSEERAVIAVRDGAADFVLKTSLARLPDAVKRAIAEASEKRRRRAAEAALARLRRIHDVILCGELGGRSHRRARGVPPGNVPHCVDDRRLPARDGGDDRHGFVRRSHRSAHAKFPAKGRGGACLGRRPRSERRSGRSCAIAGASGDRWW